MKFLRLDTTCSLLSLRYTSALGLFALTFIVCACKTLITKNDGRSAWISAQTIHTTINICLFPPLFFFSGLYYTDIVSIAVVMTSYLIFLGNGGPVLKILCGIAALFMRQTNVFWVAVYLALLEWTRQTDKLDFHPFSRLGLSRPKPNSGQTPAWSDMKDRFHAYGNWFIVLLRFFARGNIHDPDLRMASIMGEY